MPIFNFLLLVLYSKNTICMLFQLSPSLLYFLYKLSERLSGEWVGTDAWCSGSSGMTQRIHGRNYPLTVSPLCPGWPGSPSFPGGPWGWTGRQFIKIKTSGPKCVLIFEKLIWKASTSTYCGRCYLQDSLTAATYIGSFRSWETDRSLWSLRSLK